MKNKLTVNAVLAFAAFALFAALAPAAHAAKCNQETAKGSWSYSFSGSVFNQQANAFVPVAIAGRIVFDGGGKVSGSETQVSPAGAQPVTYAGTYQENADCTGTLTVHNSANLDEVVNYYSAGTDDEAYLILKVNGFVMAGKATRLQ